MNPTTSYQLVVGVRHHFQDTFIPSNEAFNRVTVVFPDSAKQYTVKDEGTKLPEHIWNTGRALSTSNLFPRTARSFRSYRGKDLPLSKPNQVVFNPFYGNEKTVAALYSITGAGWIRARVVRMKVDLSKTIGAGLHYLDVPFHVDYQPAIEVFSDSGIPVSCLVESKQLGCKNPVTRFIFRFDPDELQNKSFVNVLLIKSVFNGDGATLEAEYRTTCRVN